MRRTHRAIPRAFRVPCGSWLLPTVGSILCILLMTGVKKATGFRFLAWTVIGQIVYFSYGFWHSKRRYQAGEASVRISIQFLSTVEAIMKRYVHDESKPNLANQEIENQREEDCVYYF